MKESRVFAPIRHPKIAHLSKEDLNLLIDEYYKGSSLHDIVVKYKLNVHPSRVVNLFPPIIEETKECKYCQIKLWTNLKAKSFVKHTYRLNDSYCPSCRHIDNANCHCNNCRNNVKKKRNDEHRFLIEKINQRFNLFQHQPISLNELSIREIVYLSTLVRVGLSEDKRYLMIHNFSDLPIAPSIEMLQNIVNQLMVRKIIVIHPDSSFDAFEDNSDITNNQIDIHRIKYHVNISDFSSSDVLQFFLKPTIDIHANEKEIIEIWKSIAIEECKSYLKFSLDYVDFPYIVSEKTEAIIDNLLNHFSVSQIFGLITRCLGYTTKEFQGGKLSRKVAGAYLLGAVQIQGERALLKNWNLSRYTRPQELPESQLSKLFFNNVLNIGDLSIHTKIKYFSIEPK